MPGPPPPSKSYLLKLDSDSEDEEDEYRSHNNRNNNHSQFQSLARDTGDLLDEERIRKGTETDHHKSITTEEGGAVLLNEEPFVTRQDTPETFLGTEEGEEEDNNENESVQEVTPRKAKRNRKKKKNKKRKKQNATEVVSLDGTEEVTPADATTTATTVVTERKPTITFGNVTMHLFDRVLGGDGVPLDGGWPLGLGAPLMADVPSMSSPPLVQTVDEYEATKYERLVNRWNKHQGHGDDDDDDDDKSVAPPTILETRQWDYRRRSRKNPLFGLLIEKERMALLLGEQDLDDVLFEKYAKDLEKKNGSKKSSQKKDHNGNASPGKQGKKSHHNSKNSNSWSGRTRSGSKSASGSRSHTFHGHQERYNEHFTEFDVHHVRNELENLRNMRTQEESRGCTCRRLDVYIPPPGAGKKAAHRRMNVQKVKEELRKRHALPEQHQTRDELELLLHDLVAQEPCCRDEHCPCVKNGIECQSDACQCWHASHQVKSTHKKNHSNSNTDQVITPLVIQERCGNAIGMSTVDVKHIDQYRQPFLTCLPVGTSPIQTADV